jgi:hypothetical protein
MASWVTPSHVLYGIVLCLDSKAGLACNLDNL